MFGAFSSGEKIFQMCIQLSFLSLAQLFLCELVKKNTYLSVKYTDNIYLPVLFIVIGIVNHKTIMYDRLIIDITGLI